MFHLETKTTLTLRHVSPRKEIHGPELVQAIDLDIDWETSNESLAMFDGSLRDALYCRNAGTQAQAQIEGVATIAPNLRLTRLEMPLKWDLELSGRDLRIDYGLGNKSDLLLVTCKVKKFRLTLKEGGTVVIGFQVQCNTDVTERVVGKLCMLEGEQIEATLLVSEEPSDKPLNTARAGEKGDARGRKGKDATDLFVAQHGGKAPNAP
jgi:hypothetical protein